jgi:hypothetical protein
MIAPHTDWPARGSGGVIVALLLLLSGCATAPAPAITVKTAVAEPCPTTVPPRPAYAGDRLTGDEDLWTIGTALWAERKQRQAHELDLTLRLKGCVEPTSQGGLK